MVGSVVVVPPTVLRSLRQSLTDELAPRLDFMSRALAEARTITRRTRNRSNNNSDNENVEIY